MIDTANDWAIKCRDLSGKRQELTVFTSSDRVVLVAPPGETAVLAPLDVGRLRAALRDSVLHLGSPHTEL